MQVDSGKGGGGGGVVWYIAKLRASQIKTNSKSNTRRCFHQVNMRMKRRMTTRMRITITHTKLNKLATRELATIESFSIYWQNKCSLRTTTTLLILSTMTLRRRHAMIMTLAWQDNNIFFNQYFFPQTFCSTNKTSVPSSTKPPSKQRVNED